MCGEHRAHSTGTVTAPPQRLTPTPSSPAEVREAVRQALESARRARGRDVPDDEIAVGDALLVASELTTNAMLHGGGVTAFEVTPGEREVRVSVSDRSEELPTSVRRSDGPGPLPIGGHGWPIVCRLACDIIISYLKAGGKQITAVVPLAPR